MKQGINVAPRVSIVIPVYNKQEWILETLRSVAHQTFKDWECIIVDDGSTDSSLEIIRDFLAGRDEKWIILTQANQGQSVARNHGIAQTQGEFVAFLDGDDCWSENKLQAQVDLLLEDDLAAVVLCPYLIYEEGLSPLTFRIVEHKNTEKMIKNWLNFRGFGGGTESTGLIRKSALLEVGDFDPRLSTSAGQDLTLRLSRVGRILNARTTFMKYRIHTGQWHTNLEVLDADSRLLREKSVWFTDRERKKIELGCSAYLLMQDLRTEFDWQKIKRHLVEPRIFFHLAVLIVCVTKRNSASRARALAPRLFTKIPKIYFGSPLGF